LNIGSGAVVVTLVLIAVALALIWAVVSAMRSTPRDLSSVSEWRGPALEQLRPTLTGFHVHGDTARIYYDVPLPGNEVGEHLRDLLMHDASMVLHEKRAHGLPIDQVMWVEVFGFRSGEAVEVGVLDLAEPGVVPELTVTDLIPHAFAAGYDPLAHLEEQEFAIEPQLADHTPEEGLPPFGDGLVLTHELDAKLRAGGLDPSGASLDDLARALLRIGGYDVVENPTAASTLRSEGAGVYSARKAGTDALVVVIEHQDGDHPELSEHAVNGFVFAVAEYNPDRALLITDEFGPYLMYEKERNDPRCRFITRERLQAFVDSFVLH